jgi:hypothetical protein
MLQVTFSFGPGVTSRDLLYSGAICLVPFLRDDSNRNSSRAIFLVKLPYMGYTRDWSKMPLLATPKRGRPAELVRYQNILCYAPNSQTRTVGAIMDDRVPITTACTGGLATSETSLLNVSLSVLKASPECSLRIVVVPQVPVDW